MRKAPLQWLATFHLLIAALYGQSAHVSPATHLSYPVPMVDGNSPGIWVDGTLRIYTSTGDPLAMAGTDLYSLSQTNAPEVTPRDHYPLWIESIWRDDNGLIYAWYHHEPGSVCSNSKLTAPKIGALVSEDGGQTFRDLGIVLSTGENLNCSASNGFFAGGHGDFSVILDRDRQYFYFLFGNYSGPLARQGVSIARMAFEDRADPVGKVWKYHSGEWSEPGNQGLTTPIFPSAVSWEGSNTDSFWGPAIHWNTHLQSYVVLLNRSCCKSGWPQEGIYFSTNADLSNPEGWHSPAKILDAEAIGFAPGFYPQVFGLEEGGTDTLAGRTARLFVKGVSKWEVLFLTAEESAALSANGNPSDPPTRDLDPNDTPSRPEH